MRPATGRLIGRTQELAVLSRIAADDPDGPARLVEIAGDPGSGTTRLLDELCTMAAHAGRTVLPGRASAVNGTSEQTRQQLYHEGAALVRLTGSGRGAVLVFDDFHLADPGSIGFIDYLMAHPSPPVGALVLGYRPRQVSARLSRVLSQPTALARTRLELEPFSLGETAEFLGAAVGPDRCRRLHEASQGNPRYLSALLRASETGPWNALADPASLFDMLCAAALPSALTGELHALTPASALIAGAAAVADERFTPEIVAEVAQVSSSRAVAGIAELVTADLVRPAGTILRFSYRHPLIRAAAYQAMDAAWRAAAHARAVRALERGGAPEPVRAAHIVTASAADRADQALLSRAAETVRRTQPQRAAHWLGAAVSLLPVAESTRQTRVTLMLSRASALAASGQIGESSELSFEALRLLAGRPERDRAPAVLACAAAERMAGRFNAAGDLLSAGLAALGDCDHDVAAALGAELARVRLREGRLKQASDQATETIRLLRRGRGHGSALTPATAAMLAVRAAAEGQAGRRPVAMAGLSTAAGLLDALTDESVAGQLSLCTEISQAELALELYEDALRHAARGLELSARHGCGQQFTELSLTVAAAQIRLGRLAEAAGTALDAAEVSARLGSHGFRHAVMACQAEIALWRGDIAAGLRNASLAVAGDTTACGYHWRGYSRAVHGWAHLDYGSPPEQVCQILAPGGPELAGYRESLRPLVYDLLVQAELKAGDHEAARGWAGRGRQCAAGLGLSGATGYALLGEARWQLAAGQLMQARAAARSAAASFAGLRWPGSEGQARHVLGDVLAATGLAGQAQQEWGQAKDLFRGCGAQRMLAGVLNSQRQHAARLPRRQRADHSAAGLTAREREIVGMICAGRTNRQIAERLFLSTKTVETHLTHIFVKLGVSSRSAVAGLFAQIGGAVADLPARRGLG